MFGNVKLERMVLESTYEDTCTISLMDDVEGWNGITKKQAVPVYENIICALSARGDSSKQTEAHHHIEYDMLLFVQPEIMIKTGNQVTVKRFGRMNPNTSHVRIFEVIGVPTPYATHTQAKLKAVGIG